MQKSERLFRLVLLLRRGRVTTARELADTLEVSERTIYRDVQSLTLSGIPVEGEAGVGYILRHKLDLPPLMFTSEEAIALALGARMVMAWGDSDLEKAAIRVLEKVEAVAPPSVKENL
ncbi:MAG: DNA-binding transcriptional regulator, partial [Candidatus Hydrogenedentota bacterium]